MLTDAELEETRQAVEAGRTFELWMVRDLLAEITRTRPLVDAAREYARVHREESGDYVKTGSTRRLNAALGMLLDAARSAAEVRET